MKSFNEVIKHLDTSAGRQSLLGMQRGIEREALRIDEQGHLANDAHPKALGSALTHSRITTDYSESLLEFITPVNQNIEVLLEGLTQTHAYSVQNMYGQRLWPVSMPCYVGDEADIAIAKYGSSNVGKMKTLYRQGLTHRYGALMQIIAGVHFNFSVSTQLWDQLFALKLANSPTVDNTECSKQAFISESYFGLIRNYRRLVWVMPYLFGSSPSLCSSFVKDQTVDFDFEKTGKGTLYLPYATSLRMSDLGYTNKEQDTLNISYNSLPEYLSGVEAAICKPSQTFAEIGVKVDGQYRQLNSNILQIENEFYSPIRAKRVTQANEKPSEALSRAGVEYIEVRALDVNPYSPIGIDASQVRFLDLFLLHCLLSSSSYTDDSGEAEISANLNTVILNGRKPGQTLQRNGETITIKAWLVALFDELNILALMLDKQENEQNGTQDANRYQVALSEWREAVEDPSKTLSGRVLDDVVVKGKDHGDWVKSLMSAYHQQLSTYPLSEQTLQQYQDEARDSIAKQQAIEAEPSVDFDTFLVDYFKDVVSQ
ncbi:glutamate--cysteine ligase [Shewanella intestini]|uniref:glutamate--cysteine ligase n=1 Tax=Shewanella TaxID=22 RepID=UPI00188EEF69|nr:glutamate--cysteine ligase [Shewanella intestini]